MFLRLTDRLEVDMEHGIPPMIPSSNSNSQFPTTTTTTIRKQRRTIINAPIPALTWQERLGECLACMALSYILSLGSLFRFRDLLHGNPTSFVSYTSTVGTIISLSGSCFLSGPKSQLEKCFMILGKWPPFCSTVLGKFGAYFGGGIFEGVSGSGFYCC